MALGFVESKRDFDQPFWWCYPGDGSVRKFLRGDPLACELLREWLSPWFGKGIDAPTVGRVHDHLVAEYGSPHYRVTVAAVFGVMAMAMKKKYGVPATYDIHRGDLVRLDIEKNAEDRFVWLWDERRQRFEVMR